MIITRREVLKSAIASIASTVCGESFSQVVWPQKTIRFVVPFVPGGTSDIVARLTAQELSKLLPHPVLVENKAGGGGVPAMLDVAKSAPDGHTIILGHVGSMAVNPVIFSNTGYDVNKDFVPVTLLVKVPSLFVVHPDLPVKTVKDLVLYTQKYPGKLNYGSAGNASAGHLAMEYLKYATGMDILHIPYKGTGPALTDLIAGRIQVFSAGTTALLQYIKSGKVRAIATGTPKRIQSLPQVPTVAEAGYKGFESVQWYGIMAPAQTPEAIIRKLQEDTYAALRSPLIAERFASEDAIIGGGPSSEFASLIAQQQALWREVISKAKIKID